MSGWVDKTYRHVFHVHDAVALGVYAAQVSLTWQACHMPGSPHSLGQLTSNIVIYSSNMLASSADCLRSGEHPA